mmetsp:Transcript_3502/g.9358  ORF Transcript_3502/g.9358 Transcript_3502/m.9358 type:complete len:270 (+) Transcript_3502:2391-3200(+)
MSWAWEQGLAPRAPLQPQPSNGYAAWTSHAPPVFGRRISSTTTRQQPPPTAPLQCRPAKSSCPWRPAGTAAAQAWTHALLRPCAWETDIGGVQMVSSVAMVKAMYLTAMLQWLHSMALGVVRALIWEGSLGAMQPALHQDPCNPAARKPLDPRISHPEPPSSRPPPSCPPPVPPTLHHLNSNPSKARFPSRTRAHKCPCWHSSPHTPTCTTRPFHLSLPAPRRTAPSVCRSTRPCNARTPHLGLIACPLEMRLAQWQMTSWSERAQRRH